MSADIITFKEYAEQYSKDYRKMAELRCMYSDSRIVDELKKYKEDFYYTEFIMQCKINELVGYPIYKKRHEEKFQREFRLKLIDELHPEQNELMSIPLEFHKFTFRNLLKFPPPKEDYKPPAQREGKARQTLPGQDELITKAKDFCNSELLTMLITGQYHGQGKSLVASCIAKEKFIQYGLTTFEIFDEAFTCFNSSIIFINEFRLISLLDLLPEQHYLRYSLQQIIRRLSDCEVLVIDDMFRVKSEQTIKMLLDIYEPIVYNRLEIMKKEIIITSNKTPAEFRKISGYIYSRLKPGIIYNCENPKDYRGIITGMKEGPKQ